LFGGGGAEADEQVGFTGAGVSEQDDGFSGGDPGAGGQVGEGRGGQAGQGGEVEVFESFAAGEFGFVDAADAAAGVPFVTFGGQDLDEVGPVREAFSGGGFGYRCGLSADGGQGQCPAGGGDRGIGGRVAQRPDRWQRGG
jgi:hypothetical protein